MVPNVIVVMFLWWHILYNLTGFSILTVLPITLILFYVKYPKRLHINRSVVHAFCWPISRNTVTSICWGDKDVLLEFFLLSLSSNLFLPVPSYSLVMLNNTIPITHTWKENWSVLSFWLLSFFPFQNNYWRSNLQISYFPSFFPPLAYYMPFFSLLPPSSSVCLLFFFSPSVPSFLLCFLPLIMRRRNTVALLLYSHEILSPVWSTIQFFLIVSLLVSNMEMLVWYLEMRRS